MTTPALPTDETEIQRELAALRARMLKKSYYVMFRRAVDRSLITPSVMLAHYRWMIDLEKQGKVFLSGPVFERDDAPGVGMTVFATATAQEAQALAAQDPFCTCGGLAFDVRRWQINEGRLRLTVDLSDQTSRID